MKDSIQEGRRLIIIIGAIFSLPYLWDICAALVIGILLSDRISWYSTGIFLKNLQVTWLQSFVYIAIFIMTYKGYMWIKYVLIIIEIISGLCFISAMLVLQLNPIIRMLSMGYGIIVIISACILIRSKRINNFLVYQKSKRNHMTL